MGMFFFFKCFCVVVGFFFVYSNCYYWFVCFFLVVSEYFDDFFFFKEWYLEEDDDDYCIDVWIFCEGFNSYFVFFGIGVVYDIGWVVSYCVWWEVFFEKFYCFFVQFCYFEVEFGNCVVCYNFSFIVVGDYVYFVVFWEFVEQCGEGFSKVEYVFEVFGVDYFSLFEDCVVDGVGFSE